MVYSINEINSAILRNKYKAVRFIEGLKKDTDFVDDSRIFYFETKEADSPQELTEYLKDFAREYGSKFTVLFGDNLKTPPSKLKKMHADFTECKRDNIYKEKFAPKETTNINALIEQRVSQELERYKQQQEVEQMRKELEELKTNGGKAAFYFNQILEQIFLKKLMPEMPSEPMQGTPEPNDLENALGLFVEVLGKKTIIKLAKKLNSPEGASFIPMIKNFANS